MVVNPITVNNFASLFSCTPAGRASDYDGSGLETLCNRLVPDALTLVGPTGVQLLVFFCFSISVISCCRILIVVSSLYLFDFNVLGDVVLMN